MTTWTSLRRPLAKVGRSGRSISRQVRIASSDGRPSRRKNEPGIFPIAYIRSSTSTVSGKKSNCSLGWRPAVVADSSVVSPIVATTEPAACRASRPVSKVMVREPWAPLSMTAEAVKTPSSASWSNVSVLGADIVSSSCAACGGALLVGGGAPVVRGDRSSIEALGSRGGWCRAPAGPCRPRRPGGHYRGPGLCSRGARGPAGGWPPGPVRRVPHGRGDRPGGAGTIPSTG